MTRYRRGLVVGKFSPLHLGHELVIAQAEARCEEVIVLSYSKPEFARCDAATRERWLRSRMPGVRTVVLDDARLRVLCEVSGLPVRTLPHNGDDAQTHRRFVGWLLTQCLDVTVDAVFTSESYGNGFAASLTRQFLGREGWHGRVDHESVDPSRGTVPISGTAARQMPGANRTQMAPEVYADLVPRLCLLGGESTGKTSLAAALAIRLGTSWVAEYGRERWLELGGILSPDELLQIATIQVEREIEAAQTADGWLVCDTSPLTTLVYCLVDHAFAPAVLHELARRTYDLVVLCESDIEFAQDGTRRDASFRRRQQDLTIRLLSEEGVHFVTVRGDLDTRVGQVLARIGAPARQPGV